MISLIIVCAKVLVLGSLFLAHPTPAYFSTITSTSIIELTNLKRADSNLPLLNPNERLNRAAQGKLDDMLNRQYFSHTTPDGENVWPLMIQNGYRYSFAGENLAMNFYSADEVVKAWMNSETHKENIVSANFRDIGAAVVTGTLNGKTVSMVVQLFGTEYSGTAQEFRKTVTSALGATSEELSVMGAVEKVRVTSSPRSWIRSIVTHSKSLFLVVGILLGLILLLFGLYESKHHHQRLAHGLFVLCLIFVAIVLNPHFLNTISGSLVIL